MKTWRAFATLLTVCLLLIVLAVYERSGDDFLQTLVFLAALYTLGFLPWLLTRQKFWKPALAVRSEQGAGIHEPTARWYKNAMICAFLYGGAVFWCSVDHNVMYESCELITSEQNANWWSHGGPCRLTPSAFLDLASGVGFGLALFQFPIVIYWLGAHLSLIFQRRRI